MKIIITIFILLINFCTESMAAPVFTIVIGNPGSGSGRGVEISATANNSGYGRGYDYYRPVVINERQRRIEAIRAKEQQRIDALNAQNQRETEALYEEMARLAGRDAAEAQRIKDVAARREIEAAKYKDKIDSHFNFKTKINPMNINPWLNLRAAREKQLKVTEWLNSQPSDLPYKEERASLLGYSDLLIEAADYEYADNNIPSGDHLVTLANQAADVVMDFIPGVGLVKDAICITTGVNPVTGEAITDMDKAFIVGSIFAPSIISGVAKGTGKAAKMLLKIIKESPLRALNAERLLEIIKIADRKIFSIFRNSDLTRPMLNETGALTDKMSEVVEKMLGKSASGDAVSDIVTIVEGSGEGVVHEISDVASFMKGKLIRHGPLNTGPLHEIKEGAGFVSDTFRSASYFENKLDESVKLYRVFGGEAGEFGRYWSRTKPTGPLQSTLDAALLPEFKNSAHSWIEITIPESETIFEGVASPMLIQNSRGDAIGELLGGGGQVVLTKRVPPIWKTDGGSF